MHFTHAILAAPKEDTAFWAILHELDGLVIQIVNADTVEELKVELQSATRAAVVIVSDQLTGGNPEPALSTIHGVSDAKIILTASRAWPEQERKARLGGIFYYLLLPDELDQIRQVVEGAQSAYLHEHQEVS